jgi:hypothetical protein
MVMSASLPSGCAAGILAGLPLLATAPPGAGSAFPAPVLVAVANSEGNSDDLGGAAHFPGHLDSMRADFAGDSG